MKKIDIHADYVMYQMAWNAKNGLHLLCAYMQAITPYGEEEKAAFEAYEKLQAAYDEFEDKLQECLEAKARKESN